jgi:Cytidine and deoxycytidylate deaminase zinc-binding region
MLLKSLSSIILVVVAAFPLSAMATECGGDQHARDECYMKIALDFAKIHNPRFPFGALIVDHEQNDISCYGANSNKKNKLLHGETAAFWKYVPAHFNVYVPAPFYFNQSIYCIAVPRCTPLQPTMICSILVLIGPNRLCTLLESPLVYFFLFIPICSSSYPSADLFYVSVRCALPKAFIAVFLAWFGELLFPISTAAVDSN